MQRLAFDETHSRTDDSKSYHSQMAQACQTNGDAFHYFRIGVYLNLQMQHILDTYLCRTQVGAVERVNI